MQVPSVALCPWSAMGTCVDVAEWTRHRSTKPEDAGSTPAVDARLAVAQWTEHRPPKAGAARSTRAGEATPTLGLPIDPMRRNGDPSPSSTPRDRRSRCKPEGQRRHRPRPTRFTDRTSWSSSNGEDASTPRSRCGFDSRRPHHTNRSHTNREEGDMPTTINDKLISWGSEIDDQTIRQAEKAARLPIVEGHVALMPDAHVGIGATVGSVIPTRGAVIPSAVGVDIGCGMIAAELDVTEDQLPDSLEPLLVRIERAIPAGVGQGHDQVARAADRWLTPAPAGHRAGRRQGDQGGQAVRHAGLGQPLRRGVRRRARAGYGSSCTRAVRGIGNQLAQAHIAKARKLAKDARASARGPGPGLFRAGHAGVRRPTSATCCGPRTTPGPTGIR